MNPKLTFHSIKHTHRNKCMPLHPFHAKALAPSIVYTQFKIFSRFAAVPATARHPFRLRAKRKFIRSIPLSVEPCWNTASQLHHGAGTL